ncbi:MAG: hypothetical protein ACR2JV_06885 [Gaiellales bacterium]
MPRRVVMRDERTGRDTRSLVAELARDGALSIHGHDLGPGAAAADGEHEWVYEHPAATIPDLLEVLGAPRDGDILAVIADRYTGRASYDFEQRVRASALTPSLFVL